MPNSEEYIPVFLETDKPIDRTHIVAAHNAGNSSELADNQSMTVRELADMEPVRALELDVRFGKNGEFLVRHTNFSIPGKEPSTLAETLQAINDSIDENPDKFLILHINPPSESMSDGDKKRMIDDINSALRDSSSGCSRIFDADDQLKWTNNNDIMTTRLIEVLPSARLPILTSEIPAIYRYKDASGNYVYEMHGRDKDGNLTETILHDTDRLDDLTFGGSSYNPKFLADSMPKDPDDPTALDGRSTVLWDEAEWYKQYLGDYHVYSEAPTIDEVIAQDRNVVISNLLEYNYFYSDLGRFANYGWQKRTQVREARDIGGVFLNGLHEDTPGLVTVEDIDSRLAEDNSYGYYKLDYIDKDDPRLKKPEYRYQDPKLAMLYDLVYFDEMSEYASHIGLGFQAVQFLSSIATFWYGARSGEKFLEKHLARQYDDELNKLAKKGLLPEKQDEREKVLDNKIRELKYSTFFASISASIGVTSAVYASLLIVAGGSATIATGGFFLIVPMVCGAVASALSGFNLLNLRRNAKKIKNKLIGKNTDELEKINKDNKQKNNILQSIYKLILDSKVKDEKYAKEVVDKLKDYIEEYKQLYNDKDPCYAQHIELVEQVRVILGEFPFGNVPSDKNVEDLKDIASKIQKVIHQQIKEQRKNKYTLQNLTLSMSFVSLASKLTSLSKYATPAMAPVAAGFGMAVATIFVGVKLMKTYQKLKRLKKNNSELFDEILQPNIKKKKINKSALNDCLREGVSKKDFKKYINNSDERIDKGTVPEIKDFLKKLKDGEGSGDREFDNDRIKEIRKFLNSKCWQSTFRQQFNIPYKLFSYRYFKSDEKVIEFLNNLDDAKKNTFINEYIYEGISEEDVVKIESSLRKATIEKVHDYRIEEMRKFLNRKCGRSTFRQQFGIPYRRFSYRYFKSDEKVIEFLSKLDDKERNEIIKEYIAEESGKYASKVLTTQGRWAAIGLALAGCALVTILPPTAVVFVIGGAIATVATGFSITKFASSIAKFKFRKKIREDFKNNNELIEHQILSNFKHQLIFNPKDNESKNNSIPKRKWVPNFGSVKKHLRSLRRAQTNNRVTNEENWEKVVPSDMNGDGQQLKIESDPDALREAASFEDPCDEHHPLREAAQASPEGPLNLQEITPDFPNNCKEGPNSPSPSLRQTAAIVLPEEGGLRQAAQASPEKEVTKLIDAMPDLPYKKGGDGNGDELKVKKRSSSEATTSPTSTMSSSSVSVLPMQNLERSLSKESIDENKPDTLNSPPKNPKSPTRTSSKGSGNLLE